MTEPYIMSVSQRHEGTNYVVKVPDTSNPLGYDLVDVLHHHNGALSIKSAARSTRTVFVASRFVKRYVDADRMTREQMRGPWSAGGERP
jgi:hypothetical protein